MIRKFTLIALMSLTCLAITPNKAQASLPIGDIALGIELAGQVLELVTPVVKGGLKVVEKGGKFFISYVQKKRERARKEEEFFIKISHRGLNARPQKDPQDDDDSNLSLN